MTADNKKHHHHHHQHHHHHHQKKMVNIKSIERITNLPVVESAHAYYEKIKNSNPLIKWSLLPAETGVWLAVGTAIPVVAYFEKPVSAMDSIVCRGLDVIEANLPVVTYPPDLVYNMTKDYVTSKVVTPMLKRADSVKQLSISGANMCSELAANRLNNAIDVADKYVEKYLPDITDAVDSNEEPEREKQPRQQSEQKPTRNKSKARRSLRPINRLHVYSDHHGKQLTEKLKKKCMLDDIYVSVNTGADSSYIVSNAVKGIEKFTKTDFVVLVTGMDDVTVGRDMDKAFETLVENIELFSERTKCTNALVCPVLPQYDLPSNGIVNKTITKINQQIAANLSKREHIGVLNISRLQRRHFTTSGLYLNSRGKDFLAGAIMYSISTFGRRNNEPNPSNSDSKSKTAKTIQHVNQFGRKLQRRLTRRTIAEAKALKQQGADTVRCFVYLVDLLARDPKAFMEKTQQMWMELSKDEPENQVPPANLEQLIAMLTREMARRVVHLTNYAGARALELSHHTMHATHIAALNAVWWADYLIKAMHLESAMEVTATQVTKFHHFSIHLVELLVELIQNLKTEGQKTSQNPSLPAAEPTNSNSQTFTVPLIRSPSTCSTVSTTSITSSVSSTVTPKFSTPIQHNGDTYTLYESNHEAVAS